jgi:hypothetical protein
LVDTLQTVGVMTCSWRAAMLFALLAATVAVVGTLDCTAHAATTARLACYIALANDLGPLIGIRSSRCGSGK